MGLHEATAEWLESTTLAYALSSVVKHGFTQRTTSVGRWLFSCSMILGCSFIKSIIAPPVWEGAVNLFRLASSRCFFLFLSPYQMAVPKLRTLYAGGMSSASHGLRQLRSGHALHCQGC